jgi:serine/threonine protein kinase
MSSKEIEVVLKYSASTRRLAKLKLQEDQDAQVIFDEVKKTFNIDYDSQILKFKRDRHTIKLVAGWSIGFYELKNQTVIDVESTEDLVDFPVEEAAGTSTTDKLKQNLIFRGGAKRPTINMSRPLETISEVAEERGEVTNGMNLTRVPLKSSKEEIMKNIIAKIKKGEEPFLKQLEKGEFDNEYYDINDAQGWYPIHYAISQGNKAAVRAFLEAGADMGATTKDGITPLMLCVMKQRNELLKLILESGRAAVNRVTSKGTVLHLAAEAKNTQAIHYLISKGADPFLENESHVAAIDMFEDEDLKDRLKKSKEAEKNMLDLKSKPASLKGTVFKTGHFFRNLKPRYIHVDVDTRTLIRYKTKQDAPGKPIEIIPLVDISSCEENRSKLFLQHGFFYFEITYGAKKNLLATRSKTQTILWVQGIKKAIDYSRRYEKAIRDNQADLEALNKEDKPAEELDMDVEKGGSVAAPQQQAIITPTTIRPNISINLKNFEILQFIGKGSFGRVYKVKLRTNNKTYAMKVLNKELLFARKQIKYALSEANILKTANHPFVLSMHFAFQTPNNLYMVIDYCSGGDLDVLIKQNSYLSEEQTKFFTCELVLAMQHLHSIGVLYRDLKPENILLDSDGHIKLADFGLSRESVSRNDIAKSFCGSHIYLSPEMASRKGFTQASDNYGIGLCVYEMLYGQLPFYNEDIEKLHAMIKKDEVTFPDDIRVSPEVKDLMIQLLKKNPKERLGSKSQEELRAHPFFRGVDWDAVYAKKLKPPVDLEPEDDLESKKKIKLPDKDYTDANKDTFRIKDFSFIRWTELDRHY